MKINLYTIDQAPKALPIWQSILDDLGHPHPTRVARVLGVASRTVYRWNQLGRAPRSAALALFWLTRWGRSEVYCAAVNDARAALGWASALRDENRQLRTQLAHVLALSDTGAANAPLIDDPATGINRLDGVGVPQARTGRPGGRGLVTPPERLTGELTDDTNAPSDGPAEVAS